MLRRLLLTSILAASATTAFAAPQKYDIDTTHTQVIFSWNHFGFSNPSAMLEKFTGDFMLDTADITKSSISITFPLDGLHTGVPKLDEHLKSPDFFDAAKFPDITFKSTKVDKSGANGLKVTGDLTIHGVTKPATLDVKINKIGDNPMMKKASAGFDATTTIKRSEFGVSKYVPNVSDEIPVRITFDSHAAQ
ncbi:MAG TPA: YceI family protein [Rudaea sp.]|jgi:polyisoprenoid-binding protein YceI|nr:YceI family protein [Rudaea sp.]